MRLRLAFSFTLLSTGLIHRRCSYTLGILFRHATLKLRFLDMFILSFTFWVFNASWRQNNLPHKKMVEKVQNKENLGRGYILGIFAIFSFKN